MGLDAGDALERHGEEAIPVGQEQVVHADAVDGHRREGGGGKGDPDEALLVLPLELKLF